MSATAVHTAWVDVLAEWSRRYLLFETWTWDSPEGAARRRATWPAWRRNIRLIGAAVFWAAVAVAIAFEQDDDAPSTVWVIVSLLGTVASCCVLFGIVDGFRRRRIEHPV
jgi:hypothetical protein